MRRSTSRTVLTLLLAASIAAALLMGGCRRAERAADPTPAAAAATLPASQDAAGAELDALLEELERLNAAADPLDDLETLDDLDAYAPPGTLLAGEPAAPLPAANTPAPSANFPAETPAPTAISPAETAVPTIDSPAEIAVPTATFPAETPAATATLPAPTESPLGIELQALLDSLMQENETFDPLDDLGDIP
jgi:hypothetical protein